MRSTLASFLLFAGTLPVLAQDPPAPPAAAAPKDPAPDALAGAKTRLQQALQKTAAQVDTAFAATWGPDGKANDDGRIAMLLGDRAGGTGKAAGSWHSGRLHVAFDGDNDDELILAGRRAIAKDGATEWSLRHDRFADGNTRNFTPDPALLLQLLGGWDLDVMKRSVGTVGDQPVETVTVTLTPEQLGELIWSGALPEPASFGNVMRFAMAIGGGGRARATPPDATVDLAISFDPATNSVHKVHCRAWTNQEGMLGGNVVIVQGGGVQVGGAGDDEEDDDAKPAKDGVPTDGSVTDDNGLPIRKRKKMAVSDYTLRLSEHGTKTAPTLDDRQKQLLGN